MWEVSEEAPNDSNYKMFFVRCSLCKVPIGVMDYTNVNARVEIAEKKITKLAESLEHSLRVIDENVRRLFQK